MRVTARVVTARASKRRELVLVGGGHAHVQLLRRLIMQPIDALHVSVVVDRPEAVYSGMVPGLVAGDYRLHELSIDVRPLARRAGARFLQAAAWRVDPVQRCIELEGRPAIPYDLASLDVGSTVRDLDLPGVRAHAVSTRPIGHFVHRIEDRLAELAGVAEPDVVVVGGGAAGIELALCLDARMRAGGQRPRISLVSASPDLLPGAQRHLSRRVETEAAARDLRLRMAHRVTAVEHDAVIALAPDGRSTRLPSSLTLWASGAAPLALLARSDLPLTPAGFVRVDAHLEVPGCPDLFAVGDCAVPDDDPWVPRAGVYAVRQGPVLDHNLRARLAGRSLREYRPQRDFLALLNVGCGRAIGGKWGLGATGTSVFRLKDRIDRRFVRRFQVLDEAGRPARDFPAPGAMSGSEEMECGGCAAKVGSAPLHAALARLAAPIPDASVRVGLDRPDDAATLVLRRGDVVLATIDAFRAFADDPWRVGRVAAVNAVSDVLAKGGRPTHALALVSVPDDVGARQSETLYQVLAGIRAALDPLGVSLVGGHSTSGPELFVGLSVSGEPARGERILGLDGLREHDCLVLSKPLGTGVLLAADMRGLARGDWIEALDRGLLADNAAAARAALDHGVVSCTDVSGFGLAGHLLAMLDQSGVRAELAISKLPVYPGARILLEGGLRSTYHAQNATLRERLIVDPGVDPVLLDLLFDPQTSGGLLMAVSPASAHALVAALREAGDRAADVIGVVTSRRGSATGIDVRA